jgi:crotonobetainyl-CoA:carnitine CoA-transferase CaiB-like acyl-CoA transferase
VTAILERERSGRGQVVDVALYETAFSQLEPYVPAYDKLGIVPMREGPNLPSMAPNSLYPSRDGAWVLIAANSNATFSRLLRLMAREDILEDPRFATIRARGEKENMRALDAIVADWSRGFDAGTLESMLRDAEVPSSRVYTIADIYRDPHFAARDMLVEVPHPELGHTVQAGIVPRLSATPGSIRSSGPELGADGERVLRERLGWDDASIAAARDAGALRGGRT